MGDNGEDQAKEKKRKKQFKRMGKILATIWEWDESFQDRDEADEFQGKDDTAVLSLTDVGRKVDQKTYRLGRHGWEDFAGDVGGVYNLQIQWKTKKASQAKKWLEKVKEIFGNVDTSLAKIAGEHIPEVIKKPAVIEGSSTPPRKRKIDSGSPTTSKKMKKSLNQNSELAQREERAMEQLAAFVEERGGQRQQVANFSVRVTRSHNHNKFDTNYFNEAGRRFRSLLEVGRFLGLVHDRAGRSKAARKPTSREQEAEKKKLRKEMERLRKLLQRATKQYDDFNTEEKDELADDSVLPERSVSAVSAENTSLATRIITPTTCAAARLPDIDSLPSLPQNCIPDVLMAWNFLCTFDRALNVEPIGLDDFVDALVYVPPEGQMGDDILAPPVYLAEAHLGLLKLLLHDKSSDDWWWSVLETSEVTENRAKNIDEDDEAIEKDEENIPPIKVDMAALLAQTEDPLITTSWLLALEKVSATSVNEDLKLAIKTAMKVVANKWVMAYLRKTLHGIKSHGLEFARKAVLWLVARVRESRPDLLDSSVKPDKISKAKKKVVEEAGKFMEDLPETVPSVTDQDVEVESDEDDDSDESDDEEDEKAVKAGEKTEDDDSERVASALPPKPLPSFVDMLLPPSKPTPNDEFVNAFTWPHLVGATVARTLHRRKRVFNEIDDSLRHAHQVPPLKVAERRERERLICSRVLTECVENADTAALVEEAIAHLCKGGSYIQLSGVQRLCILRLLIEACYDSLRVYDVVSSNYKQRMNAVKALENEQRRAKKEAKEKAAADEAAAREQLAAEAREKFLDEKREEIRKLNEKSEMFSEEVMESLTYEDIIDFDEDIKADYEALPGPESFSKTEVNKMIARLQEEAAFDTEALRVITMDELLERDKRDLEEMEGQLLGFGGEDALLDSSLDRETVRSVERLQRDIEKAKAQAEKLPEMRRQAIEQLKDAVADGTIKVLRSAIAAAKKAKLTGPDDETGGSWAVDVMRDAALELEKAKQNKRVFDAQKDLVAKRNKCFIRCDPLGQDRFGNCFWTFTADDSGHIWTEAEFSLKQESNGMTSDPPPGFADLTRDAASIAVGAADMEADFIDSTAGNEAALFYRQEYHSTGFSAALVRHHWGCHMTEESLRALIKTLDSRQAKEKELKAKLKDSLEVIVESNEKKESAKGEAEDEEQAEAEASKVRTSGDETVFQKAKDAASEHEQNGKGDAIGVMRSAIGAKVRIRIVVDASKEPHVCRYESGSVTGWRMRHDQIERQDEADVVDEDKGFNEEIPVWKIQTDRGRTVWCGGEELIESLARYKKWTEAQGYFESDAAFLAYRNHLGRYCGKATEAPYASSPNNLARLMVKRESELYPKLKTRSYDNNWGGKSGARNLWTNSMKDYAYDFATVQQGLLTLEAALFELTGSFSEYENVSEVQDVQAILDNPSQRFEIELETLDKSIPGLWNSPVSRAVFIHIVSVAKTTGFLALALDLLCRNTTNYLRQHKLLNVRTAERETVSYETTTRRTTRRMNAWQQKQQGASIYAEIDEDEDDWE